MLSLTPQAFVELVVLGVYWEHWPPKPIEYVNHKGNMVFSSSAGYTTVDHVLKVFKLAEVVKDDHVKLVHHKREGLGFQRKLLRHCGVSYGSEYVTNNDSWLLCQAGKRRGEPVDLARLVRTQRIAMLDKGVKMAPSFEEKHAALISKEAYLKAADAFRSQFANEAARLGALKKYHQKTEHELNED
jgi:hypothetical protein